MRPIHDGERKQRGCSYCKDLVLQDITWNKKYKQRNCPHEKCPYHELDDIKTYKEYLKKPVTSGLEKILENLG